MAAEGGETREQLLARQEAEEEELEERVRAHLEPHLAGGKSKKAKAAADAAEREVEQWRYEMSERHREELEALEEGAAPAAEDAESSGKAAAEAAAPVVSPEESEAAKVQRKKEKAQQKKQNRAQKAKDKEEEIEREKANAGPSQRELELAKLTVQLAKEKPHLAVHEVMGDGHCLYRAVADQIRRYRPDLHSWNKSADLAHEEVRVLCAQALRKGKDDYECFAELKDGENYQGYCSRVENSADWGGHLELRALADTLRVQILVYRAGEDPITLGNSSGKDVPLRLTFHQFWFALGEHYNSAVLQGDA